MTRGLDLYKSQFGIVSYAMEPSGCEFYTCPSLFLFQRKTSNSSLEPLHNFQHLSYRDTPIVQFVHISSLNAASFEIAQVVTTIADKPSLMRPDNIELSKLINLHNKSLSDETWTKYQQLYILVVLQVCDCKEVWTFFKEYSGKLKKLKRKRSNANFNRDFKS